MADKRLYGAVVYNRHGHRSIIGMSHSKAALRRQHVGARIFRVESTPDLPSTYVIVGKEIAA